MNNNRPEETALSDYGFDALNEARNYRRALVHAFAPHLTGNILDVGAGAGQLTELFRGLPDIKELVAVEPDEKLCAELRVRCPGCAIVPGTIDAVDTARPWNGIVCINVLEHILEDARELASYHRVLKSAHGHLCLFVPARPELYAPIDAVFGHHRRYTKKELRRKLEAAGFEIVRLNYFNWIGYFGWWFNFRLLGRRKLERASVRLFDRVFFPPVNWWESRICRPPFGQSLLAVARAK